MMIETERYDPFDYERLYGDEKYSLNNMLMKSYNFPARVKKGDLYGAYQDRISELWYSDKAKELLVQHNPKASWGDHGYAYLTDESLLNFAQYIADALDFGKKVTGARIIRFTNAMSGYPVYYLEFAHGGESYAQTKPPRNSHSYGYYGYDYWLRSLEGNGE